MTIPLHEAIDGARYIRSVGRTGGMTEIYAWKGGHTVNVYTTHNGIDGMEVHAARCFSVGSFEQDAADRQEVKDAVQREITESQQEV